MNGVTAYAEGVPERFVGFPKESVRFLDDLEVNNNRDWFLAHKATYEEACRQPMEALLAELEPKYGPGRMFRINRDIRFSPDKSPYKTHIGAMVGGHGYISLSPESFFVGGGGHMLEGNTLARFRQAVAAEKSGRELERIVLTLEKRGYDVGGEALKSAPKGYSNDHPRIRLLRHKGVTMGKQFGSTAAWLSTRKALDKITAVLDDGRPLFGWFDKYTS
jgi:uncharacterized protein (TIGR02453 family)